MAKYLKEIELEAVANYEHKTGRIIGARWQSFEGGDNGISFDLKYTRGNFTFGMLNPRDSTSILEDLALKAPSKLRGTKIDAYLESGHLEVLTLR